MKLTLRGDGSLTIEFSGKELDAQIQLLKMFKVEDKQHARQMDDMLNTLQLLRTSRK